MYTALDSKQQLRHYKEHLCKAIHFPSGHLTALLTLISFLTHEVRFAYLTRLHKLACYSYNIYCNLSWEFAEVQSFNIVA